MVPDGWRVRTLGEICDNDLQTGPFGSQLHAHEYIDDPNGICVVMPRELSGNRVSFIDTAKISERKAAELAKHELRDGDIVFSRRGDVSRTAVFRAADPRSICGTGCLRARPSEGVDHSFLAQFLTQQTVGGWLLQNAVGQTMPNLNTQIIGQLPVRLPPLPEQKKIADILSTWDKAIETTEKLLANAERQKQALMQQLLTGKRRLKGFEGEWSNYRLGDISNVQIGGTPARANPEYWNDGSLPWLAISDLGPKYVSDTSEGITEAGAINSNVKLLPKGVVIMSFKLTIGKVGITARELYTNEAICGFIPLGKAKFTAEFLYQYLQVADLMGDVDQAVKGKTLNKAKLKELRVSLPSILEQKAIGEILLAADQEISLFQANIANLRKQKRALMQQLLTGKRRVTI